MLNRQFLEYLVDQSIIRKAEFDAAFPTGALPADFSVEENFIKPGLLTQDAFRKAGETFFGAKFAADDDLPKEPTIYENLSVQFMKEARFIPGKAEDETLTVIMANPYDYYTLDAIRLATKKEIQVLLGEETKILEAIERSYGTGGSSMEKIIEDMESIPDYQGGDEENVDQLRDMASEGPVIRLVNLVITRAIERRASDIHLEPFEDNFRVRYRVDGVLHDVEAPSQKAPGGDHLPGQNHGQAEHRRTAPSPGRTNHASGEGQRD
jgi:hypothetical protein